MKQAVLNAWHAIRNAKYFVKLICFSAVCLLIALIGLKMNGVVFAYSVRYGDSVVAQVKDKSVWESGKQMACGSITSKNPEELIYIPKFSLTLTLGERLSDSAGVCEKILSGTNEIVKGAALVINGETVALSSDADTINGVIENRLSTFNVEGCENTSEFVGDISVMPVYCSVTEQVDRDALCEVVAGFEVKTVSVLTKESSISYVTVTHQTEDQEVGYYSVDKKGVNGVRRNVEQIVYLNGVEIERTTVENSVVKEPVNEVVTVGVSVSRYNSSGSSAEGMLFPLKKNDKMYISTYFKGNSGRHKGIDLTSPKGTPIYSVLDGTVTEAGYRNDYGYYILVNHGNGLVTRYAHCSQLLVSRGDKVYAGQTIGLVGSTGQSTGNHLHFEVIVNGTPRNPLNYIG